MKAENYKISKLSYIENGSNEIMERYQIHTKYETEPPHGDAIYSISIKGKALPFWIYGRDVTFIGSSMVMVESVRCKTWDPIETIIIDLENDVYASLKEWYTDILFESIYPKAYLYAINLKSLSTLNAQNYLVFSYPFLQLD